MHQPLSIYRYKLCLKINRGLIYNICIYTKMRCAVVRKINFK